MDPSDIFHFSKKQIKSNEAAMKWIYQVLSSQIFAEVRDVVTTCLLVSKQHLQVFSERIVFLSKTDLKAQRM